MKLVTFTAEGETERRLGVIVDSQIYDVQRLASTYGKQLPSTMLEFLRLEGAGQENLQPILDCLQAEGVRADFSESVNLPIYYREDDSKLLAPLPTPTSFRDFYAFEAHVKTARAKRGLDMIPEWYQLPVFYFSNHHAILGPEDTVAKPVNTEKLDFELEVACVIGKRGKNIATEDAETYVAGYMILNDWSARDIQRREMKVGLGPAKGKDFATSIGPWLVTADELADRRSGNGHDLVMIARINGCEVSRGNMKDLYWSFGEMIARASEDVMLQPGDLIGSGTVGTGCILELGEEKFAWLQPGDRVELEIERLGVLQNTIV